MFQHGCNNKETNVWKSNKFYHQKIFNRTIQAHIVSNLIFAGCNPIKGFSVPESLQFFSSYKIEMEKKDRKKVIKMKET